MKKHQSEGPIRGEGFFVPGFYTTLPYDKLHTLSECKKWLKDHNHGWFDMTRHYPVVRRMPKGKKTYMKGGRFIEMNLKFNGFEFKSQLLSRRQFREIVSGLMEIFNDSK